MLDSFSCIWPAGTTHHEWEYPRIPLCIMDVRISKFWKGSSFQLIVQWSTNKYKNGVFKFKKCKNNVPCDLHSIGIIHHFISSTVGHLTRLWNFSQYFCDHLWDEDLNEMVLSTLVCLRCVHHYCNFCFTICKDSLWKNEEKVRTNNWYLFDFLIKLQIISVTGFCQKLKHFNK